ncbi:hypothetical protein [Gracilibacillus saliphilus]|uniref:hypothetical protein n=1 Tax=Gracilibacillus saliphilus TaxID=543890 RepID=UPI0013D1801D|nr:hypothetical protein [Gracilibacillus saliphilus]
MVERYYRDPDPIEPLVPEYDKNDADPRVLNYTKQLREKMNGIDVRESLARTAEITSIVADTAKVSADEAIAITQSLLDGTFDDAELATAIEEKLNQLEKDYAPNLTTLQKNVGDLSQFRNFDNDIISKMENEFTERGVNVKWFGASGSDQFTTGSIVSGSNELTVADAIDFEVGQGILIEGAGTGGVEEVAELQITSAPTTAGDVLVTLDGISTAIAVDPAIEDTAIAVADKIRNTAFTGWTTGGTAGTDTVTFTCDTTGEKQNATYNDNGTGVSGAMTTTTEGQDGGNLVTSITAINGTVFTLSDSANADVTSVNVDHDDTQSIINAINYVNNGMTILFPYGYKFYTTSKISIPSQINVIMNSPIIYRGTGGETALTIGESGISNEGVTLKLNVSRETISDWENDLDIGIKIINAYTSYINIVSVTRFTIGVMLMGSGSGFVYNRITLGNIGLNHIGLDLTNETYNSRIGWINDNKYSIGRFWVASSTHTDKSRYGVRVTSIDGTYTSNNNNLFIKPSFELKQPTTGEAIPVLIVHGQNNEFESVRSEGNGKIVMRTLNEADANVVEIGYGIGEIDNQSIYKNNLVILRSTLIQERVRGTIFNSGNLAQSICLYDNDDRFNLAGLQVHAESAENPRAFITNLMYDDKSITLDNQSIGLFISTKSSKKFVVKRDVNTDGGRVGVIPFDSSGNRLNDLGAGHPYVSGRPGRELTWNINHGGCYLTGVDSHIETYFSVGDDVDYIELLITGDCTIRSFRVDSVDSYDAATWLIYDQPIQGVNVSIQKPALNSVGFDGQITLNLAPSEQGNAGSKYVVEGWQKVNGIWLEKRSYTGN